MLVETGRQSFFLPFFLPRPSLRGRNDLRGGGQLGEISGLVETRYSRLGRDFCSPYHGVRIISIRIFKAIEIWRNVVIGGDED